MLKVLTKIVAAAASLFILGSLAGTLAHAEDGDLVESPVSLSSAELALQHVNNCPALFSKKNTVTLDASKPNPMIARLRVAMRKELIGQDLAIDAFLDALETMLTGLSDPNAPLGKFLFLGPTGVGKTEIVRALVRALNGDPDKHMIRVDCGEFQQGHELSRLIGSSAGLVGYEDKPMLHPDNIKKARLTITLANGAKRSFTLVLIDEIEKAADKLFNLLLGILDNGRVTLGNNTVSDFRETIILGTSNLGAKEVNKLIDERRESLKGRDPSLLSAEDKDLTGRENLEFRKEITETTEKAVEQQFKPEFIQRWDAKINFLHLDRPEFEQILQKELAKVQRRVFENGLLKVGVLIDESFRKVLIERGTDIKTGARPLRRTIKNMVIVPLSRMMSTDEIKEGDLVYASVVNRHVVWSAHARNLTRPELAEIADKAYAGYGLDKVDFDKPREDITIDKELNILRFISENKEAAKRLYIKAKHPARDIVEGNSTAALKYVKVVQKTSDGDQITFIRLKNAAGASEIAARLDSEIAPKLAAAFPVDKIDSYTEEELRVMMKDLLDKVD